MAVPVFLLPVVSVVSKVMKVPVITAFFSALVIELFNFFAKFATKRIALMLALIAALTGLILTLFSAIQTLLAGLPLVVPEVISNGIAFFMPANVPICLSAVIASKVLRWAFSWQFYFLDKITG